MCGIAGILASDLSGACVEEKVGRMISVLHHRGPDDGGLWRSSDDNLVLGHRRLSIQDLSEFGKQPMHSQSKRYCIVFNGEIYNFQEIAAALRSLGHQFSGHSDTEVLLAAVEEWGLEQAVIRFVGMFAFALYDRETKTLHLCRDRLGEKPLYYGWIDKVFYFASELKAIAVSVSREKLETNFDGLSDFLKHGYISAPQTIYRFIHKLLPGTILSIPVADEAAISGFSAYSDAVSISPKKYWSVIDSANQGLSSLILSEQEAVAELDNSLHRSIRRQMIADVDIGTFLSGGIDSTVVSAIAQSESSGKIKTYTIGFSEKEYDESAYAEKIAKHLGTDHLTMRVTAEDALNVVPDLASIYDEPFADSSQIPTYLVSRLAREHVTVCLSGDGGDELFAGYNRYLWTQSLWRRLSIMPYSLRFAVAKLLAIPSPDVWDGLYQTYSRIRSGSDEKQKLVGLKVQKLAGFMQQKDIYQAYEFLMSYWTHPDKLLKGAVTNTQYGKLPTHLQTDGFINRAMCLDQMNYLPGDNLAKVDRASMAVSLETRLPLLSHELIDLSWRIPVSMKVKNGVSKWALRQVLYKYVPQDMIDRPKMGFSVPVAKWLRDDLKGWAEDLLNSIDVHDQIFNRDIILKTWHQHVSGKRDHSHRLWTVLMYLSWAQNH